VIGGYVAFLDAMARNNLIFDGSTAAYTRIMTAPLHERSNAVPPAAPPVLLARALICSGCHRETMRYLAIGSRAFCEVCLERSRSAAGDGELGGEC